MLMLKNSVEVAECASVCLNKFQERLLLGIQQRSCFFQVIEHSEEWPKFIKIIFCSCIGDANISALVTPLPYGRIIGDAFGDNLIAFYNDLILQNNLTDFLLCGFDIPNPIRRIRIKLPAENIEVLTAIANCFSKRDKRTIFQLLS